LIFGYIANEFLSRPLAQAVLSKGFSRRPDAFVVQDFGSKHDDRRYAHCGYILNHEKGPAREFRSRTYIFHAFEGLIYRLILEPA